MAYTNFAPTAYATVNAPGPSPGSIGGGATPQLPYAVYTLPAGGSGSTLMVSNVGQGTAFVALGVLTGIVAANPTSGNAGTGYLVGDVITVVQSGASGGKLIVTSIGAAGAVTGFAVATPGAVYSVATGLSTTGGTGSALQIDVTAIGLIVNSQLGIAVLTNSSLPLAIGSSDHIAVMGMASPTTLNLAQGT